MHYPEEDIGITLKRKLSLAERISQDNNASNIELLRLETFLIEAMNKQHRFVG